jgi:hypothetical protein
MTDQLDTELASIDPAPAAPVDPRLRAAILADVRAEASPPARRRRRRRAFPLGLFAAVALASGAVAAVVAIRTGDPAPKTVGLGSPVRGPGDPLAGSVRLLPVRAADPAGGLAWGIRTYRTGRGAECWQIGRVLGNQLGVIGQDGLLGDDGLFHALPVERDQCRPLDGAGHLFAFQNTVALANGSTRMTCTFFPRAEPKLPVCRAGRQRIVWHGFLGPDARSVTIDGGATHRVSPSAEGAFMFIDRQADPVRPVARTFTATYVDGSRRTVDDVMPMETTSNGPPRGATPPGYVAPERDLPRPSQVRAVIKLSTAHQGRNVVYRVQFRAPVATRQFGVEYSVRLDGGAAGRRCSTPLHFGGFNTPGNVRAGQRLTIDMSPAIAFRWNRGWCPGTYHGRVVLHDRAHTVGTFTFTVPG